MSKKEDDERIWNFVMFKFYGTDKELEDAAPGVAITLLVIVGGLLRWALF